VNGEGGYYTAAEAARILRLSSQRVRQLLASGELQGVRDEVGHWKVDARSVHAVLKERREALSEALEEPLRVSELEAEVRELRYLLGHAEGRLELMKRAESALQAELARKDHIIATLTERIGAELEPASEPRESPVSSSEGPEEGVVVLSPEAEKRPWWQRMFSR
jgi:excisionase family DNA binding protein